MTEATLFPARHRPTGRTVLRIGGVLLGLTLVGACQTSTARRAGPRYETAFSTLPTTGNRPLVSLPNSGGAASVTETQSSAGLRQRIILGQSRGRIDLTIASAAPGTIRRWRSRAGPASLPNSRASKAVPIGSCAGRCTTPTAPWASPWAMAAPMRGSGSTGSSGSSWAAAPCAGPSRPRCAFSIVARNPVPRRSSRSGADAARPDIRSERGTAPPSPRDSEAADAAARRGRRADRPGRACSGRPSRRGERKPHPRDPFRRERRTRPISAQPAPVATTQPAVPTVPRPASTGGAPDRPRFLTDALPPSRTGPGAPSPDSTSPAAESSTRTGGAPRPPQGW